MPPNTMPAWDGMLWSAQNSVKPRPLTPISINGLLGALPHKDRFQSVGIDYG